MRTIILLLSASILALGTTSGCAHRQKEVEKEMKTPVDCRTADAEIRVLKSEKTHVAEQIAEGVTAIVPIGLVIGIVTGTEGTKMRVAIGHYNKKIDERIALIQSTCAL